MLAAFANTTSAEHYSTPIGEEARGSFTNVRSFRTASDAESILSPCPSWLRERRARALAGSRRPPSPHHTASRIRSRVDTELRLSSDLDQASIRP
jgi:hypothetical protein